MWCPREETTGGAAPAAEAGDEHLVFEIEQKTPPRPRRERRDPRERVVVVGAGKIGLVFEDVARNFGCRVAAVPRSSPLRGEVERGAARDVGKTRARPRVPPTRRGATAVQLPANRLRRRASPRRVAAIRRP